MSSSCFFCLLDSFGPFRARKALLGRFFPLLDLLGKATRLPIAAMVSHCLRPGFSIELCCHCRKCERSTLTCDFESGEHIFDRFQSDF